MPCRRAGTEKTSRDCGWGQPDRYEVSASRTGGIWDAAGIQQMALQPFSLLTQVSAGLSL